MSELVSLAHLLRLLDDEAPVVREAVSRELSKYGARLGEALEDWPEPVSRSERQLIEEVTEPWRREQLLRRWPGRLAEESSLPALEHALGLLAEYQSGLTRPTPLSHHLRALAEAFAGQERRPDPVRLARFLFEDIGLTGARDDYHHPSHSNLVHVVEEGRGLPISLALIFVLVGARLGLRVEPCNLPHHFCARFRRNGRLYLIDGYHGPEPIPESLFLTRHAASRDWLPVLLRLEVAPGTIAARVLRNMARAYREQGKTEIARMLGSLQVPGVRPMRDRPAAGVWAEGQLVRHRQNLYRGVIVESDVEPEPTDPDLQPWYRVLVDGQGAIMRVPQKTLALDDSKRPVDHPLVPFFFSRFMHDRYERNAQPWPTV